MALPFRRPGQGGGYLNGVSGVINSITFKAGKSGTTKAGNAYTNYSGVALVTPDGATEAKPQFLDGGFLYGDNVISKDGKTIEGADQYSLDVTTQLGKFIVSMVERESGNVVPEELVGDLRNYDAIAGARVLFARVRDAAETERRGKRTDKKTGKEYDRDQLLVADVLSLPEVKKGGKKAAAPKAAGAKAAPASNDDADAALKSIIEEAGGVVPASALGSNVVRFAVKAKLDSTAREALRKVVTDDAYLADAVARGVIAIEGEGKERQLLAA